jgi:hypothetical protein
MATKYKPILFSTEMVQAILEGRKTQTRRIVKSEPKINDDTDLELIPDWDGKYDDPLTLFFYYKGTKTRSIYYDCQLPLAQIGDILWVRESFQYSDELDEPFWYKQKYKEDYTQEAFDRIKWKPSIHMPKEAARIFLEVTNVRVERLKDISEEDAIAEGVEIIHYAEPILPVFRKYNLKEKKGTLNPILSYQTLWGKINGEDSWKANPWVWVYEFKQVDKPKDFTNEH